jgi:hypothetical protein
MTSR